MLITANGASKKNRENAAVRAVPNRFARKICPT
jgi:hypothetical protein